jgi:hypothetical protein
MRRNYRPYLLFLLFAVAIALGCKKDSSQGQAIDPQYATPACVHNLEVIKSGKDVWAEQNQKGANDTPTMEDLAVHVRHMPTCPSGGAYTIGKVGELPTCSVVEHQAAFLKKLEQPAASP